MRLSLIIFLAAVSLSFGSCQLNKSACLKSQKNIVAKDYSCGIIQQDGGKAVFQTKLDFFKYHFSGLLAIKRIAADDYKLAFMSEMGMTLLSMSFSKGEYKVHNVMEALNRPIVMNAIQNDLKILMLDRSMFSSEKWKRGKGGIQNVRVLKGGGKKYNIHYNAKKEIVKIEEAKALNVKKRLTILERKEAKPSEMVLNSFGIKKAKMIFKKIKLNAAK